MMDRRNPFAWLALVLAILAMGPRSYGVQLVRWLYDQVVSVAHGGTWDVHSASYVGGEPIPIYFACRPNSPAELERLIEQCPLPCGCRVYDLGRCKRKPRRPFDTHRGVIFWSGAGYTWTMDEDVVRIDRVRGDVACVCPKRALLCSHQQEAPSVRWHGSEAR